MLFFIKDVVDNTSGRLIVRGLALIVATMDQAEGYLGNQ